MATAIQTAHRSHHLVNMRSSDNDNIQTRTIPILTPTIQMSAPSPGDPMDISTPTSASAPQSANRSPDSERNGLAPSSGAKVGAGEHRSSTPKAEQQQTTNPVAMPAPAAAAAAVHQPKIVQTAFIHKLYNMLEDPNIQHLISWSPSQESFLMSPSNDFSKVLAQYFKHTNISSFVRQLNMYGFHKVSDVFHNGSDSTLWEFKHGNNNFKRGDIIGLREIKRRASRHALVHKEYNQRPTPPQPGTPAEPMPIQDGADPRIANMENALYDLSMRLQRSEESSHYMHIKQQAAMDTMGRLLQLNQELARTVLTLVPNPDNPTHRDVVALQGSLQRQADMIRTLEEPHDQPLSSGRHYFSQLENAPVSPRQVPQDDPRRANLTVPPHRPSNYYRPQVPSNLSLNTRRPYGSIGAGTTSQSSPSSLRPQPPPPPAPQQHPQHPLANVELPPSSLARRHTSADIRGHGWPVPQASPSASGPPSGPPSTQWPSSPNRSVPADDQRIRDSFSTYSLQNATPQSHSRPETPPPPPFSNGGSGLDTLTSWTWNSASSGRSGGLTVKDSSGPPTRRGSMAHILNPTDTAESPHEDMDDPRGDDDRKRKRLQ
ncbi:hypothetical protein PpBr36_07448 [Pyricularia pennisetigena]|uniref:hypothetical protein n=1 Tax=Pyricularia pennisetigena TaxID=1578925 RepID=UPI00115370D2|nr:hypothetical protein PpBr36_07448 [Pyricularia pennisetigena]TLS25766.1 hypothetical protein PpBr36_07448 [Pyricularia pennisetigena]